MACNLKKILEDAYILVAHLKDHEKTADMVISHSQSLYKRIEGMKQYQESITELNEIAKHRPRSTLVIGIAQENRQIRELQQENRELRLALEEHQSALELIMQKYREQINKLIESNVWEKAIAGNSDHSKELETLMDKICEMGAVMHKSITADETECFKEKERLQQLEVENKGLRELLEICSTSRFRILEDYVREDRSCQTDSNESVEKQEVEKQEKDQEQSVKTMASAQK
ncbi:hypothetical protein ACJMK2_020429 [Sinanodonta woodiana]|uniref:Suppressor of IKBKE 1 n=1 Tax=Sinanodonta woodiana TaxID=1069815 RepID=A0ABD3U1T4_SINWO